MATLRQYTTPSFIQNFLGNTGVLSSVTENEINRAEIDIDSAIADFYMGRFGKCFDTYYGEGVFTNSTLTISGSVFADKYFTYTAITVLDGDQAGLQIPVTNSINNVLTFDTVPNLSGSAKIMISQVGKFPMYKDYLNCTLKVIPLEVQQAVAYQVEYNKINDESRTIAKKKREYIGKYYEYENFAGSQISKLERVSDKALALLDTYLHQSI